MTGRRDDADRDSKPCPPRPPYGIPIRDAAARGDLPELRCHIEVVRESLAALSKIDAKTLAAGGIGKRGALAKLAATLKRLESSLRELES